MKKIFLCFIIFTLLITLCISAKEPVIVGYFAEWDIYGRNYHVADIPADKLTHINYAFAKISPDGEVSLFDPYAATEKSYEGDNWEELLRGNFKQLQLLKKEHPHLKTLIAIGGWTLSDLFTDIALTPESRVKFAISAVNFMEKYDFNGIDIDWEYPCGGGIAKSRPEDKQNFTLLIAEIRNQLNELEKKTGQKYLLTVAAPAGDQLNHYELSEVSKYIDWYNLMAYDFHGAWENTTNHQAPLYSNSFDLSAPASRYNVAYAVSSYIHAGVSPDQIVLGIPLYSRAWSGVHTDNNGLFQSAAKSAQGTWENGILDYSDLHKKIHGRPDEYIVFWDDESKVSWVFNPYVENGAFYTYEDLKTVSEKMKFIKAENLRGAMFWEVSGDIRNSNDPQSLINVVHKELLYK